MGLKTLSCIAYRYKDNSELIELADDVLPIYLPTVSHFVDNPEYESSKNLGAHQLAALQFGGLCSAQPGIPLVWLPRIPRLGQLPDKPMHPRGSFEIEVSGVSRTSRRQLEARILSISKLSFSCPWLDILSIFD